MIYFSIRHSLKKLISDPEADAKYVGTGINQSALIEIKTKREEKRVLRFLLIPPQVITIWSGILDKDIKNVSITPDKNVMCFSDEKNTYFMDIQNKTQNTTTLQNITKCIPICSHENEEIFIFEKKSTLFQVFITKKTSSSTIRISKSKPIIKKVVWWDVIPESKILACVCKSSTTNQRFRVLQYQKKLIEIFDFEISDVFGNSVPTHFFIVNSHTVVVANVSDTSTLIITYPSLKVTCIPYTHSDNVQMSMVNEILIITVPDVMIALVDADGGKLITKIVENKELICHESLSNLVQSRLDSSIFFDTKNLCFISLDVDWMQLSKLLQTYDLLSWHFVAHLSAAHTPVTFFTQDIIMKAPNNFSVGIMHYFLEYCISGVCQWISPDTPSAFLNFIPHMTTLTSIMENEPSEESILSALIDCNEFFIPIETLVKTDLWTFILKANIDFCPKGFWKLSTLVMILLFYFETKTQRQKFVFPLCDFTTPILDLPSLPSDNLRSLKGVTLKQTIDFLFDYIKKFCAVAQALPPPTSDATNIEKLRYELTVFATARRFHLPYNVNRLPTLEALIVNETPVIFQYIMAKDTVIQTKDIFKCKPKLWNRIEGDQKTSHEEQNDCKNVTLNDLTASSAVVLNKAMRENQNYFTGFIPYKVAVERLKNDDDERQQLIKDLDKYSLKNLSSRYL